ncbi:MAG: type II secretion system F family protein [Lachnospiraceae bacterium]|nr:type II secretion system F family protein [Lachnospiraceae bacterium]
MAVLTCFWRKTGAFLVDILKLDQPEKGGGALRQELAALQVGRKETIRAYWIRKICYVLAAGMVGLLLAAVSFGWSMLRKEDVPDQRLQRPAYGEGNRTEALEAEIDGEEVQTFEITVRERAYTEAEKQQHLDAAILTLDEMLPGANSSLDEVRQDLAFPKTLEDGAVQIGWTTVPYGVIDESGRLLGSEDVDGVLVEIQGTLTCGGKEALYTAYAKVFPQEMPKEEQLHQSILNELSREDSEHGSEAVLELPAEVDGRQLHWLYDKENPVPKVFGVTFLAIFVIWVGMDQQIHRQAKERQAQLLLDYPDLMWKLAMLLGAGMSMKGAFWRLSGQYERKKNGIRYVYEELTCACYEMQSGIAEAEAYERFGRRCQLPEYIRLGTVLSQNLRKGTKGLNAMLEQEAAASFTERKNNARKLGEKAGTKLLFPMLLMLGIVLVILMVPAFLSF